MGRGMIELFKITESFDIESRTNEIIPWGNGHINQTYRVITEFDQASDYLLQRINTKVFEKVDDLMENMIKVTQHIRSKPDHQQLVSELVPTKAGTLWLQNETGAWRMQLFIDDKESFEIADNEELCRKAGRTYGTFLAAVDEFPVEKLNITITKFHDINFRLQQFEEALKLGSSDRIESAKSVIKQVKERAAYFTNMYATTLQNLPLRVTHNDTKLNNVLLGENEIGTVIDLDTVMPGFSFFDIGDALRSIAISAREDEPKLDSINVNTAMKDSFLDGYLSKTEHVLSKQEISLIPKSGAYMAYILAVRFLTDYLNGDTYYKTKYQNHNLVRAENQLVVSHILS